MAEHRREWAGLLFAAAFPSLATWIYFVVLAGHPSMRLVYGAGKLVMVAFPLLWVRLVAREPFALPKPAADGVGIGFAFGLLVAVGAASLYTGWLKASPAFADAPAAIRAKLGDIGAATPARFLALAAFISILHSGFEEYYWRWFVFGRLRRRVPAGAAAILSGLAFMAHHVIVLGVYFRPQDFWTLTIPLSLGVGIGGMAWAWLYDRSQSIYASWVSHCLVDLALMAIGYDLVFGTI